MQFEIEYRKNKIKPGNWIGMNFYAAKEMHIPFHHKHKNVIEIWKTSKPVMKATEKHEEIEYYLMCRRGMSYHKAHKYALRFENSDKRVKDIVSDIL